MNYARQQKDPKKQGVGFLVVVLLHVGLGYLFVTGLGHSAIEVLKQPLETKLIEEVKPPDAPPPPPAGLPPAPDAPAPPPAAPAVLVDAPAPAMPAPPAPDAPPPGAPGIANP